MRIVQKYFLLMSNVIRKDRELREFKEFREFREGAIISY